MIGAAASPGFELRGARPVAAVLGLLALVLGVHAATTAALVDTWSRSVTYSHGFIVVPAFAWLVWTSRHRLAALPVRPAWPGLAALVLAGLVWVAAQLAALAAPAQFAVIAMVPAAVAAVLGLAWTRALAYALAFLFLAVPFGESLVPAMMDWTAGSVVSALELSGIPAYREGTRFAIASGEWSVVESCSGVRYLFACLTVACLFAWSIYRSWRRRTAFIAFALLAIVAANWIRAYAVVVIGHVSGNRLAVGIDHVIYGAGFFMAVMTLVFAVGVHWREPLPAQATAGAADAGAPRVRAAAALALLAAGAILAAGPSVLRPGPPAAGAPGPLTIAVPAAWSPVDDERGAWAPVIENPAQRWRRRFAGQGSPVGLEIGVFGRPAPGAKLFSAQNRLVRVDDANRALANRHVLDLQCAGRPASVAAGSIVGRDGPITAWQWFVADRQVTAHPGRAALLQLEARLGERSEQGAWVAAWTSEQDGAPAAALRLQAFFADICAPLVDALSVRPSGPAPSRAAPA